MAYHPATDLWLVSRYADIRTVLADDRTFAPDNALHAVTPLSVAALRVLARHRFSLPPTLANNATETHPGLRRLVAGFFDREAVTAAEPGIRELAAKLIAPVAATEGPVDLVAALAAELPTRVLYDLIGVPLETLDVDLAQIKEWSGAGLELFWGRPGPDRQLDLARLSGEFHQWIAARIRAATPGAPDLFGRLAGHRVPDGSPLKLADAVGVCFFLLIAGQETTAQLLSTVLHRMLADRPLWTRLAQGERGLAAACVEEVLRREPSVVTWKRQTTREVDLAGVRLPAGAKVLLMLAAAGSDETVHDQPEQLCPMRPNARRHLAFGHGKHFCVGAELARTESAVVLDQLARTLPELRPVPGPDPEYLGLLSFRAPLKVRATH
ncbi:cytochrome P450 [Pseudonocardiaceae bacterium YIM PH 21723]|nr:cytochrome P450 [Pseudonocardiaceae bacterium YIM PH 21723]